MSRKRFGAMFKRLLSAVTAAALAVSIVAEGAVLHAAAETADVTDTVVLYAVNAGYAITPEIPDNYATSYQADLTASQLAGITWEDNYYVSVSDAGVVTPKQLTWYYFGGFWNLIPTTGYTQTKQTYSFGHTTLTGTYSGGTITLDVTVKDYADVYVQKVMDDYLSASITDGMSETGRFAVISDFVSGYSCASNGSTSIKSLILNGTGSPLAFSELVCALCDKAGLQSKRRMDTTTVTTESGTSTTYTYTNLILVDGVKYRADFGTIGTAPRTGTLTPYTSNFEFIYNDVQQAYAVSMYTGFDQDVTVPAEVNGYPVVRILAYAFSGFTGKGVKSVTLPDAVTVINANAFNGNPTLETINFGSGLKTIGANAFSYATRLTAAQLPAGVTSVGDSAFKGCTALESISLPSGLTAIPVSMASDCTALKSVVIPSSVTTVGDHAFNGCSSLQSADISAVTAVKEYTFNDCAALTSVKLSPALTMIDAYAFMNCVSLSDITLPESLTNLGIQCFFGCAALESLTIPAGVKELRTYTFRDLSKLVITVPATVTSIASDALLGVKTIRCERSSTAYTYAKTNRVAYQVTNPIDLSGAAAVLSQTKYTYTGNACKPSVKVTLADGTVLTAGTDYTMTYADNTAAGTATATVSPTDISIGSITLTFTISPASMTVTADGVSKTYDGKAYGISVTAPGGAAVSYSTDQKTYSATKPTYSKAGTYTVYYKVTKANYAVVTGSQTVKIAAKSIFAMTASLSAASYTYSGAAKKPTVTLKNGATALKLNADYTVTYSANALPGKATVTVKGKGNFTGTKTLTFTIKPKTPVATATAGTKKATVKWGKVAGASGYTVYMATSKTGTYTKIATVSSTKTSYAKTGLTTGKTYYFKLVAYKVATGGNINSAASAVVLAKIK
ncbi:MAG: leucine-rich repeat protein [Oscillospiraceae bacterium]